MARLYSNESAPQGGDGTAQESDERLMSQFAAGDAHAFESLYRRYRNGLFRFIVRQVSSDAVAEELFQDVWLKIINARDSYRVEAKFSTYIFTIARRRIIDHYRGQQRKPVELDSDIAGRTIDPESQTGEAAEHLQHLERFARALNGLPDEQREAFLLHIEGGMDIDQIAAVMQVKREAAKSRLRYAVNKLKQALKVSHERHE